MTAENAPCYLRDLSALIERRYRIPFRIKAMPASYDAERLRCAPSEQF